MKTRSFVIGSALLGMIGCTAVSSPKRELIETIPLCSTQTLALQAARANHAASYTTDLDIPSEALQRVRIAEQAYQDCSGIAPSPYPPNTLSTEKCAAVQRAIANQEQDYATNCMINKPDWTLEERGRCIFQERSLDQLRQLNAGCSQ